MAKDQALAVAYEMQKRSKKKKMAEGGLIDSAVNTVKESFSDPKPADKSSPNYNARKLNPDKTKAFQKGFGYAEGGQVEGPKSIASAIMAKRMADGGMVDIEDNNTEEPRMFDDLNEDALKENYSQEMTDVTQPEESKRDRVQAIRSRMISKRIKGE